MKKYPKDCKKWLLPKSYKHFDSPIKTYVFDDNEKCREVKNSTKVKKIVQNPDEVAKHSFYPFIGFDIKERKFGKSKAVVYEKRKLENQIKETSDEKEKQELTKKTTEIDFLFKAKINKERPIRYSSHMDNHIYAYYSKEILLPKYEKKLKLLELDNEVLAYREVPDAYHVRSSNITMAKEIFENILKRKNECIALAYDIKGFYDHIDHDNLKKTWCDVLDVKKLPPDHYNIYKSLTNYCFVDLKKICEYFVHKKFCKFPNGHQHLCAQCRDPKTHKFPKTLFPKASDFRDFRNSCAKDDFKKNEGMNSDKPFGIPQGSAISSTLSNIYMLPFDIEVKAFVEKINGIYRRYCDDIMIICDHNDQKNVDDFVRAKIVERGKYLEIHPIEVNNPYSKSQIYDFTSPDIKKRPLQYLGFCFDGENVRIREASLCRYMRKAHRGVMASKFSSIKRMNDLHKRGIELPIKYSKLFRKTLYERYSLVGKNNFLSYVERAFDGTNGLSNKQIVGQIKGHFKKLKQDIDLNDVDVLEEYNKIVKK